jgi:hypothetical protein
VPYVARLTLICRSYSIHRIFFLRLPLRVHEPVLPSLSPPSPPPPDPIPCATGYPCPDAPSPATLPSAPMRPPRPFLLKSASHGSPRSRTQLPPPPRARSPIPPSPSPSSAPFRGGRRAPPTSAVGMAISHRRLLLLPTVPHHSIHGGALQRGSSAAPHPLPVFCFSLS